MMRGILRGQLGPRARGLGARARVRARGERTMKEKGPESKFVC